MTAGGFVAHFWQYRELKARAATEVKVHGKVSRDIVAGLLLRARE